MKEKMYGHKKRSNALLQPLLTLNLILWKTQCKDTDFWEICKEKDAKFMLLNIFQEVWQDVRQNNTLFQQSTCQYCIPIRQYVLKAAFNCCLFLIYMLKICFIAQIWIFGIIFAAVKERTKFLGINKTFLII